MGSIVLSSALANDEVAATATEAVRKSRRFMVKSQSRFVRCWCVWCLGRKTEATAQTPDTPAPNETHKGKRCSDGNTPPAKYNDHHEHTQANPRHRFGRA